MNGELHHWPKCRVVILDYFALVETSVFRPDISMTKGQRTLTKEGQEFFFKIQRAGKISVKECHLDLRGYCTRELTAIVVASRKQTQLTLKHGEERFKIFNFKEILLQVSMICQRMIPWTQKVCKCKECFTLHKSSMVSSPTTKTESVLNQACTQQISVQA